MKQTYPIILIPAEEGGFTVYIPDFDISTQGNDIPDAMFMARDAIGITGIYMQDEKKELPVPSKMADMIERSKEESEDAIVTLVDIDFDEYRRKNETRAVRRNVSLPSWLDYEAQKAGINVSAILQNALKKELGFE